MKLEGYRLVFVVVGLIGVLLIASPEIAGAIPRLPAESQFSELYLLGPNQMAANYGVCFLCGCYEQCVIYRYVLGYSNVHCFIF